MDKNDLRKIVRGKRKGLTQEWWAAKSDAILQDLIQVPAFKEAKLVACYLDVRAEVGTRGVLERCWAEGKDVCVPAHDESVAGYSMAMIDSETKMTIGNMGIDEPAEPSWVAGNAVDLFLVPGLAFDDRGGRVGYGGGYYDRLMSGTGGVKAALAFDFQVFDEVPVETYDILLNMIITETRVLSVT